MSSARGARLSYTSPRSAGDRDRTVGLVSKTRDSLTPGNGGGLASVEGDNSSVITRAAGEFSSETDLLVRAFINTSSAVRKRCCEMLTPGNPYQVRANV